MVTEILLTLCIAVCLCAFYQYAFYKPNGFPPGPPRLPIFGSYLFMMLSNSKYLHKGILNFSKWYKSDIVGLYLGPTPMVVINNPSGVREMLNRIDCDGRPHVYTSKLRDPNMKLSGIFFQEGLIWKEQRRFFLRQLRDYGFGRRYAELESVIQEELSDMVDLIKNGARFEHEKPYVTKEGMRILLPYFFNPFAANSIFYIIFNERKVRSQHAELWQLVRHGMLFQRTNDDYGKMLSIIPWIRHIFPNWSSYNALKECNTYLFSYFERIVDRHIKTFDESGERNFIDLYIKQMLKADIECNTETTFTRHQLILSLIDFTFPAFTAIGVNISFLIQYLLLYPKVQKRIQIEIDERIGKARLPTLEDRPFLPYTEACIREVLRIETLVPSDVPHKALTNIQFMGYKIPKGTLLIPSLYAHHHDERFWGDPEAFRPERFLDEEGKLCLKKDVSLPFGTGKRLCPGETFARNMLSLMVTTLCQNFSFVLNKEDKYPDPSTNLSGLITSPKDFWVQLKERL